MQFLAVIEIEPMNARAYIGAAEAYLAQGEIGKAIAILQDGLDRTGDEEIRRMLEGLTVMEAPTLTPTPRPTPAPTPEPTPDLQNELEEGMVTVYGTIIDNCFEYEEQWMAYNDQYGGSVSIPALGIRFNEDIEIVFDGEIVLLREAGLIQGFVYNPESHLEVPLKLTGWFERSRDADEINFNETTGIYTYNPNGEYIFSARWCEILD